MSNVQISTNHSLQSLAINIRLEDEINAAVAAKSKILLQFDRVNHSNLILDEINTVLK